VIAVAVRWYLRYCLSSCDVKKLLAERGVEVDHVTVYRWVQRFTPLMADGAAIYPAVLEKLVPSAWHHVEWQANNPIEADHSQLKDRLRPMRGLRTDRTAQTVVAGHAFMQNLRRGHYELAVDAPGAAGRRRVRRARSSDLDCARPHAQRDRPSVYATAPSNPPATSTQPGRAEVVDQNR
jgi:transposase-like protein